MGEHTETVVEHEVNEREVTHPQCDLCNQIFKDEAKEEVLEAVYFGKPRTLRKSSTTIPIDKTERDVQRVWRQLERGLNDLPGEYCVDVSSHVHEIRAFGEPISEVKANLAGTPIPAGRHRDDQYGVQITMSVETDPGDPDMELCKYCVEVLSDG